MEIKEENITEAIKVPEKIDVEVVSHELDLNGGKVYAGIFNKEEKQYVHVEAKVEIDESKIEFVWEEDRSPTYVPYGERSVLFSSGNRELEEIHIEDAVKIIDDEMIFFNPDDDKYLNEEEVEELLKINKDEYKAIIDDLKLLIQEDTEEFIVEYYENNPPEREDYDSSDDEYDNYRN